MATQGLYDTSNPLAGLLTSVLGQETDSNTTANQTTNGTQDQHVSSTENGQQSQLQRTSNAGNAVNEQVTRTQGTNTTRTSGTSSSSESISADVTALRQILARQLSGISPEMLAAIFREGSKAAPQMLVSQANALGARAGSNTPLAAALNLLNGQMLSKAADVNTNMLRDAAGTAGKIADMTMTRNTSQSSDQSSVTYIDQTSSMFNKQQQTSEQLINGVINNNKTVDQNSATRNNQNISSTEDKNVKSTINKDVAGGLAAAFGAGYSINELFKQATGKGFTGNMIDFAKWLMGQGASPAAVRSQLITAGIDANIAKEVTDTATLPSDPIIIDNVTLDGSTDGGHAPIDDFGEFNGDFTGPTNSFNIDAFTGEGFGFADGGVIEPQKTLIQQNRQKDAEAKQQDAGTGMDDLLNALLMAGVQQQMSGVSGAVQGQQLPPVDPNSKVDARGKDALSAEEMEGSVPEYYEAQYTGDAEGTGTQRSGVNVGQTVRMFGKKQTNTGVGPDADYVPDSGQTEGYMRLLGVNGNQSTFDVYDANGKFVRRAVSSHGQAWMEDAIMALAAALVPGGGMVMAAGQVDQAADTGDTGGMLAGVAGAVAGAGGVSGAEWAGTASKVATGANVANQASKGNYVNAAAGAAKLYNDGTTIGKADGGTVHGPGTGISDSIPAIGPGGQNYRLSAGETIIPADVTEAIGPDFFQRLIDMFHTPAEIQRAMGVK